MRMRSAGRAVLISAAILGMALVTNGGAAQQVQTAAQLVRDVAYNELHDHESQGYWRYWVEKRSGHESRLEQHVETSEGTLARLLLSNGQPLDDHSQQAEGVRLMRLINSPQEQALQRQNYEEDEKRIGTVIALMPDAFLYDFESDENGFRRLRFRPNPGFVPRSVEARVVHALSGELWVDARLKRLARIDGRLDDNVDFGFGMLGRLNKGGWLSLQRMRVNASEWKTERLEVHVTGRAMMFKTIGRETSEVRGGFAAIPSGNLEQGARILQQTVARGFDTSTARVAPAALTRSR
jgi:hypothetical protein